MTQYVTRNGLNITLQEGEQLYDTCSTCPVFNRCKRVTGESPLPNDYLTNDECNGHTMVQRALELARIPREYKGKTANDFEMQGFSQEMVTALTSAFTRSTNLVDTGSNIALMSPNKGTGKTLAGTIIMNEFIYANCMTRFDYENPIALYIKFGQWANDLRTQYQVNDDDFTLQVNQRLEQMKKVPLLMLDDIGSGRITPYIRDILYDVIDYRKESGLSTIFTTNLNEMQLNHPDCLGDMITSRMFFNTVVYQMNGVDRRRETIRVIK